MTSLFAKAVAHEQAGEFDKARELLERCAKERCHDQGDLAFHLGWCIENSLDKDTSLILQYYKQASANAASGLIRLNGLFRSGWVLMQDRDQSGAEAAFNRAIELAERSLRDHELYHHALFWHAVCLENLGRYLDAAEEHAKLQPLSPALAPESSYREIVCHTQVGRYDQALAVCRAFSPEPPQGFAPDRYAVLYDLVKKEEALLDRCLSEESAEGGKRDV